MLFVVTSKLKLAVARLVADATPKIGVTNVGEVVPAKEPLPLTPESGVST